MTRPLRCATAIGLLVAGVAFILLVNPAWTSGASELTIAAVATLIAALVPDVRRIGIRTFERLRSLSPRQRIFGAVLVGLAWLLVVPAANALLRLPFQVMIHDEHQFRLQARMLAHGRLWMPPHELVDSFDTFYVLMTPKYAPQSFPGAALMYVPGVWLPLATWVMPLLISAVAIALTWWVISEIADPAVATVGAIALFGMPDLRMFATISLAQFPALLLGLVAIIGWLNYRRTRRASWVLLIGAALGWCLITRPLDAACFGLIVGVGVIAVWVRSRPKHVMAAAALGVVGTMPFVALQLTFNRGITGTFTQSPFDFYNQRDQPALAFGGHGDLTRRPLSIVPQKQWFYDFFTLRYVNAAREGFKLSHVRDRIDVVYPMVSPGYWAVPLAFIGVMGLATRRQWAVATLLPLFVVAYGQYPIFAPHYITFAVPAVALLYGRSPHLIGTCLPDRMAGAAWPATAALLAGFAVANVFLRVPAEGMYFANDVQNRQIAAALNSVSRPAIVLFEADRDMRMHEEPVYNDDVVWPDDAPVIKAHSLPEANPKLFAYYAARQPNRTVYAFDRRTFKIRKLGNVVDLARQFPTTRP